MVILIESYVLILEILIFFQDIERLLQKISESLPESSINPDGSPADNVEIVSKQISTFNGELKKQLNYLFNADVYDILFAGQSPLCRVGKGKLLVEEIIDKIGRLIGKECGETMDNVNLKVNSYTAPYENRQQRRSKNKKGRR